MSESAFCSGLADIASRYQAFIIDQWGVLHDGGAPYPGAIDCLERLRAANRRIVLLSNSGKRAAGNKQHLRSIGFDPKLFDEVVTSGEATWQALAERTDPFFEPLGRRCFMWSRGGDRSHIEGLRLELVEEIDDADFVLLAGIEDDARLEQFVEPLRRAAERALPLICANPDMVVVRPGGGFGIAPGTVARHYEEQGGRVAYVGKPHRPVYEACLRALGDLPRGEVLAIGDSIEHDIAGGAQMGLDTALVMAGIHADAFDLEHGLTANRVALEQLESQFGARPRWVLPQFRWFGA